MILLPSNKEISKESIIATPALNEIYLNIPAPGRSNSRSRYSKRWYNINALVILFVIFSESADASGWPQDLYPVRIHPLQLLKPT
jgi:hypothetical protein